MPISKRTRDKIVEGGGLYENRFYKYEAETHLASGTTYIAKRSKLTRRSVLFYFDTLRKVEKSPSQGLVSLI